MLPMRNWPALGIVINPQSREREQKHLTSFEARRFHEDHRNDRNWDGHGPG
jgi:hypothetical protein